jgi:hypothetical protein
MRAVDAYRGNDRLSAVNRAGQLLAFGTMVHGSVEQVNGIREDAAGARLPLLENRPESFLEDDDASHYAGFSEQAQDEAPGTGRPETLGVVRSLRVRIEDEAAWQLVDALAFASLDSVHGVERAAAAAVLAPIDRSREQRASAVLQAEARSGDALARHVALAALGAGDGLGSPDSRPEPLPAPGDLSIAIHGTWARLADERWYAPGSELHDHIREQCTPCLYGGPDYFRWTGGYSEQEREQAASDLAHWLAGRGPWIHAAYAHSHGGNVALTASSRGVHFGLTTLLHTPITPRPDEAWSLIRRACPRVLTLRSRLDLVMLADGRRTGSTLDPDQRLLPHRRVLPHWNGRTGWFSHGLFVRASVWRRWKLANEVRYELP